MANSAKPAQESGVATCNFRRIFSCSASHTIRGYSTCGHTKSLIRPLYKTVELVARMLFNGSTKGEIQGGARCLRISSSDAQSWLLCCWLFLSLLVAVNKTTPPQPKAELLGLADFHNHQFSYKGFGGKIISHSIDPSEKPCYVLPPFDETTLLIRDLVRHGIFSEAKWQAERDIGWCYPTATSLASQRMDTANLKRAWQYGLRLIVMFAVSSEFLCKVAELANPCPSDRKAIDDQIQAAKDLEKDIAEKDGGWYRIVYTPEEAREVILQNKLAVVLGIETSNAFGGCYFVPRDDKVTPIKSDEILDLETTWALDCKQLSEPVKTQVALALFEHYWRLGIRHFYPIHNMDGVAGGAGLFNPTLHADINPSELSTAATGFPGRDVAADADALIRAVRPPVKSRQCGSITTSPEGKVIEKGVSVFDGGRCNALGLTETGVYLIRKMESYGAIIDIDHMSLKAKLELYKNDLLAGYPLVSSHTGINSLNHGTQKNETQLRNEDIQWLITHHGAIAPILPPVGMATEEDTYPPNASIAPHTCGGTSESWVQAYRYVVDQIKAENDKYAKLNNGQKPYYVGVGFGTEFSAPIPVAVGPRFEGDVHVTAETTGNIFDYVTATYVPYPKLRHDWPCYKVLGSSTDGAPQPHVNYGNDGFISHSPLSTGMKFKKSETPWGHPTKTYDISFDGMVHVGMIPDFVEELYALRLTDEDLQPMWHGAEAYVRTWERGILVKGFFTPTRYNEVAEICSALREQQLLNKDLSTLVTDKGLEKQVTLLVERLKRTGCDGFPDRWPSDGIGALYMINALALGDLHKIDAPSVAAGLSKTVTFFLSNRGSSPITVTGIRIERDPTHALSSQSFPSPIIIPSNLTSRNLILTEFSLEFHPSESGQFEATVVILSDEPGLPELPLRFVGKVEPPPFYFFPPETLEFGSVVRGSTNIMEVEFTNNSYTTNISVSTTIEKALMIPPPPDGQFSLAVGSPETQVISPRASKKFQIIYAPTVNGGADAVLVLHISLGTGESVERRISLHGEAVPP